MPIYLAKQTLKEAVERLSRSSAQSSLGDYLIFKRALQIRREQSGSDAGQVTSVVTGLMSDHFVRAIRELALRLPIDGSVNEELENPYFVPFGAAREKHRGYRGSKFPSNGSSDTVGRWQSRPNPPIVLVPDTSPKEFRFEPRDRDGLVNFFIKGAKTGVSVNLPRLLDAAIWWFRFIDLEDRFGAQPTVEQLERAFMKDLGLTETEQMSLFSNISHTLLDTGESTDVEAMQ
jgi:hypothetical protein